MFPDSWFYLLYFQQPGVAEAEFEADIPKALRTIFTGPPGYDPMSPLVRAKKRSDGYLTGLDAPATLPAWLTEEDLAYFVKEFSGSGFRSGLNRYRNMDRDWHELPELATTKLHQPALFVIGEQDPGRAFAPIEPMKALVPHLREPVIVPGALHWVQQERPAEVNAALLAFLKGLPT
jgi:pimeloyl-ACP methyl ester carboxylesterase